MWVAIAGAIGIVSAVVTYFIKSKSNKSVHEKVLDEIQKATKRRQRITNKTELAAHDLDSLRRVQLLLRIKKIRSATKR